jgi:hypothetical protein
MHHPVNHQHDLIIEVLSQIAQEKIKTLERIKRLLFIQQNHAINRRFWEIIDEKIPYHRFTYVGCCAECGFFELC